MTFDSIINDLFHGPLILKSVSWMNVTLWDNELV